MLTTRFPIHSRDFDYEVTISDDTEMLLQHFSSVEGAVFVVDKNISVLYPELVAKLIQGRPKLDIDATESTKTLTGVGKVVEWLLDSGCNRSATIVGVGGGIIQDVVTFTAAIYYRGVNFELVPTTLLSMADSSIGAKCGINFGDFKNQLGIVNAPRSVHISTAFLETLADRDILSGYGEILKLSITGGEAHLARLFELVEGDGLRASARYLIEQSLLVKKEIIEEDEHERDLRRILNYGHTFGHALEALTNHAIPHGLSVAWGIDVVNLIAVQRFGLDQALRLQARSFISRFLPFQLNEFPSATQLLDHARRDKKMVGSTLNLVVPVAAGELKIVPTKLDDEMHKILEFYLENENIYQSAN